MSSPAAAPGESRQVGRQKSKSWLSAIVLITQNFNPEENWTDKMQLSKIFTGKRYGLYNYGSVIILFGTI